LQEGGIPFTDQLATPDNKPVAGCGRRRRPSTQPATRQDGRQNLLARLRKQQYFSREVRAGSATAGALSATANRRRMGDLPFLADGSKKWMRGAAWENLIPL
jgi:hypothetical protein